MTYATAKSHAPAKGRVGLLERAVLVVGVVSFISFDYLGMVGLAPAVNALQMLTIAVSVVCLLARRVRIGTYQLVWLVICLWISVTTLVNGADVGAALRLSSKIALPLLFFTAFRGEFHIIVRIMYVVLGALAVANLVTILAFPDGMYVTGTTNFAHENWLLGFKNKHIVFYLPLTFTTFYLIEADGLTWDKACVLIVVAIASLLAGSSTTILCIVLVVALVIVPFFRKRHHVFNARNYFVIWLVLFFLVVVLRVQNGLVETIVGLFGKDMTFSNRTLEWDIAMQEISRFPLMGQGYLALDLRHILYMSQSVMSAHDQLLEYALVGGVVLVALYLLANLVLVQRLQGFASARIVQFASALYFGMLVVMLAEVYEDALFYALYFMVWNAPDLVSAMRDRGKAVDCES